MPKKIYISFLDAVFFDLYKNHSDIQYIVDIMWEYTNKCIVGTGLSVANMKDLQTWRSKNKERLSLTNFLNDIQSLSETERQILNLLLI